MLITYNGHNGNPGNTVLGIWPADEPREVPDELATVLIATGNYDKATPPPARPAQPGSKPATSAKK
jgi:hypothetical protein